VWKILEIEPLRRLGIDLSEARLQQDLFNMGINASYSSLTQAEKAILRYRAVIQQTSNAQGKSDCPSEQNR
jgi:hypothetical protein